MRTRAFSLIEVTLSLGIVSFALTAILGLLPLGLSNYKKASDLTIRAQINQQLLSTIQRTPFDQLQSFGTEASPTELYFDHEGKELPASEKDNFIYNARIYMAPGSVVNNLLSPTWSSTPNGGVSLNTVHAIQMSIINRASPEIISVSTTYVADRGL